MRVKPKAKKRTATKKVATAPAIAIHAEHQDGVHHIVGLGNIRVILMPDNDGWFAQGLEIDYAAQGENIEDAKHQFEEGLDATIREHLRVHNDIRRLLVVAPNDIWRLVSDPNVRLNRFFSVTSHQVIRDNTNYEGIDYLIAARIAEPARRGTCQ